MISQEFIRNFRCSNWNEYSPFIDIYESIVDWKPTVLIGRDVGFQFADKGVFANSDRLDPN